MRICVGLGLLLWAGCLVVLPHHVQAAEADAEPPQVTRADLAHAYLRLEQAYFAHHPLEEARRREINKTFDRATLSFFLGRFGDALRTIDSLGLGLAEEPPDAAATLFYSLKVQCDPPVLIVDAVADPRVRIHSLYEVDIEPAETLDCELCLLAPDGTRVAAWPLALAVGSETRIDETLDIDRQSLVDRLQPGTTYAIELRRGPRDGLVVGRWPVALSSFDTLRKQNADRLTSLALGESELNDAWTTCRARNELLTDVPSSNSSTQFLTDPNALAASVEREVDLLAQGEDPYHGRTGDYWRVLQQGRLSIPLRVFVPETDDPNRPRPLWIVLHGAGGDENMFLDAYGAGRIKELATEHDCLVASPLTYSFGSRPEHVAALIDSLERHYAIDRSRVYLVGHSMGAGAAAAAASSCRDQLAAVCCIAGGRSFDHGDGLAPTLVVVPELDAIIPPRVVAAAAMKAREAGAPVELRELADDGHTLVVGAVLPEVVDWLLEHRLSDESP